MSTLKPAIVHPEEYARLVTGMLIDYVCNFGRLTAFLLTA
jgi:hypothetical protein